MKLKTDGDWKDDFKDYYEHMQESRTHIFHMPSKHRPWDWLTNYINVHLSRVWKMANSARK